MLAILLAAALEAQRIVSLAPSLTEDLFAIGAGARVIAVDRYSARLAQARGLPQVGSMLDATPERILALHPDLVVGVPLEAPALAALERAGVRTEVLSSDTLTQDFSTMLRLGRLTGTAPRAEALVRQLRAGLVHVERAAARQRRLRAFVVVATAPIYTAGRGSFVDELLRLTNVENTAASSMPWTPYSPERLVSAHPDILIVSKDAEIDPHEAPWSLLYAVRASRVIHLADDLVPGPHVVELLEHLMRALDRLR
ncbi:hypothetical protein EPN44_00795 [bacterium]|nr:MAG: hypothetical protein EPN44_00795 [bacterium]